MAKKVKTVAKKKKNGGRVSWTAEQVKELRASARKLKAGEIAKKMHRTEGAVRQKAHSLGLSLSSR